MKLAKPDLDGTLLLGQLLAVMVWLSVFPFFIVLGALHGLIVGAVESAIYGVKMFGWIATVSEEKQ